jgi:hypothetical protein
MMRAMVYEAAQILLVRSVRWSWLKAWAMKIARRRGMKKAIVALARRLAVTMHRIWVDGTEFRWTGNRPQQHESQTGSTRIGGNSSSTERWNGQPHRRPRKGTRSAAANSNNQSAPSYSEPTTLVCVRFFELAFEALDERPQTRILRSKFGQFVGVCERPLNVPIITRKANECR